MIEFGWFVLASRSAGPSVTSTVPLEDHAYSFPKSAKCSSTYLKSSPDSCGAPPPVTRRYSTPATDGLSAVPFTQNSRTGSLPSSWKAISVIWRSST